MIFLLKKIIRKIYTLKISQTVLKHGKNLKVNGKSSCTKTTILGDNVNFNGMIIQGKLI